MLNHLQTQHQAQAEQLAEQLAELAARARLAKSA
jgi:hypothetical protein